LGKIKQYINQKSKHFLKKLKIFFKNNKLKKQKKLQVKEIEKNRIAKDFCNKTKELIRQLQ
jgi:hypothetical protein